MSLYQDAAYLRLPSDIQRLVQKRFGSTPNLASAQPLHLQDDLTQYGQHHYTVNLTADPTEVWRFYTAQRIPEAFAGPMVQFVMAYDRQQNRRHWQGEPDAPTFGVGVQIYCSLYIGKPRILIGLEVLRVDAEQHEMEVAYITGGLFRGTQRISLHAKEEGTLVKHHSFYWSGSFWLDRIIYPYFHHRTVGEFHRRARGML